MEWLPIETAPRDGTWALLSGGTVYYGWDDDNFPPAVCGHHAESGKWYFAHYESGYYGEYENPTHWVPLPNPPKA